MRNLMVSISPAVNMLTQRKNNRALSKRGGRGWKNSHKFAACARGPRAKQYFSGARRERLRRNKKERKKERKGRKTTEETLRYISPRISMKQRPNATLSPFFFIFFFLFLALSFSLFSFFFVLSRFLSRSKEVIGNPCSGGEGTNEN